MTAAARINRPLSLRESLPVLARARAAATASGLDTASAAAAGLEALIEGLLGAEAPSSPEGCERALGKAEQAALVAAELAKAAGSDGGFAADHGRELMLVGEAVSQHVSRLGLLARSFRAQGRGLSA